MLCTYNIYTVSVQQSRKKWVLSFSPHSWTLAHPWELKLRTVHAAKSYLDEMIIKGNLLVKLNFQNTFKSIRQDSMLKLVLEKAPLCFPSLLHPITNLPFFFGNYIIQSCEGVQEGHPFAWSPPFLHV